MLQDECREGWVFGGLQGVAEEGCGEVQGISGVGWIGIAGGGGLVVRVDSVGVVAVGGQGRSWVGCGGCIAPRWMRGVGLMAWVVVRRWLGAWDVWAAGGWALVGCVDDGVGGRWLNGGVKWQWCVMLLTFWVKILMLGCFSTFMLLWL